LNTASDQSSAYYWNYASYANNGAYYDGEMAHTWYDGWPYAWLQFSLPTNTLVRSFFVFMRENCCVSWRNNF